MSNTIKYTEACGACGPAVEARASCTGEYGPEWVYDGPGSCNMCQFNCVSFGALGPACTVGTKAKCRHVAYLGDKKDCCLGNKVGDKLTCNPAYVASSSQCDDVYRAYCVGDKIIKDTKCINWRNERPTAAAAMVQQYCLANMNASECREWCRKQSAAGNPTCDTASAAWCKLNSTDQYCACLSSPASVTGSINPKCIDDKCIRNGYMTQNMKSTACPNIVDCTVQANLVNTGMQLASGVKLEQNCGNTGGTPPSAVVPPGAPTTVTSEVVQQNPSAAPVVPPVNILPFLALLFVIFVALVGSIVYYTTNKTISNAV